MRQIFAWVCSGIGTNAFLAPTNEHKGFHQKYVQFATRQALGYLSKRESYGLLPCSQLNQTISNSVYQ